MNTCMLFILDNFRSIWPSCSPTVYPVQEWEGVQEKFVTESREQDQECECIIPHNSMPLVEFKSLDEIQNVGVYYQPANKRYGTIDSLFKYRTR